MEGSLLAGLELGASGFLAPGVHRATFEEVRRVFVNPEMGDVMLREAVFDAVTSWSTVVRRYIGPGAVWLSGGFVARGEAGDLALVAYLPDPSEDLSGSFDARWARDWTTLGDVTYRDPEPGGWLPERWAVGGLVDGLFVERRFESDLENIFCRTLEPAASETINKGCIEVLMP